MNVLIRFVSLWAVISFLIILGQMLESNSISTFMGCVLCVILGIILNIIISIEAHYRVSYKLNKVNNEKNDL